jgi:hypothetical protein
MHDLQLYTYGESLRFLWPSDHTRLGHIRMEAVIGLFEINSVP